MKTAISPKSFPAVSSTVHPEGGKLTFSTNVKYVDPRGREWTEYEVNGRLLNDINEARHHLEEWHARLVDAVQFRDSLKRK